MDRRIVAQLCDSIDAISDADSLAADSSSKENSSNPSKMVVFIVATNKYVEGSLMHSCSCFNYSFINSILFYKLL